MSDRETKLVDDRLTLTKGSMDDWWLIERAEHAGREWMEPLGGNGFAFQCSSRITDADIEGTGEEMIGLAVAIQRRGAFIARRCSVEVIGDRAEFWSPRNSTYRASVPMAVADELATQILKALIKENNPDV